MFEILSLIYIKSQEQEPTTQTNATPRYSRVKIYTTL